MAKGRKRRRPVRVVSDANGFEGPKLPAPRWWKVLALATIEAEHGSLTAFCKAKDWRQSTLWAFLKGDDTTSSYVAQLLKEFPHLPEPSAQFPGEHFSKLYRAAKQLVDLDDAEGTQVLVGIIGTLEALAAAKRARASIGSGLPTVAAETATEVKQPSSKIAQSSGEEE